MKKDKLLTISFLCPGRSEDAFKTLESLQPILKAVDSELVIVDTGCPEEFRKRLEAYTDRIIPFTWTGDFAEARNVGVDNARGKWFLTIDDDEWFIDPSEIIQFFNEKHYKKFDAAVYTVRNFLDYEEKNYTDSPAMRIFNIEDGARWQGRIHEGLLFKTTPRIGALNVIAKHFGYIFASDEERLAKHKRNIEPLLELCEEQPEKIHWPYQLVQEYTSLDDYESAAKVAEKAIIKIKDDNSKTAANQRNTFYMCLMRNAFIKKNFDEMWRLYDEITSDRRITKIGRAGFAQFAAEILLDEKKYEKALECCKTYNEMYDITHDDPGTLALEACIYMDGIFSSEIFSRMQFRKLYCQIILGIEDKNDELFEKIKWESVISNRVIIPFVMDFVPILAKDGAKPIYSRILDELVKAEDVAEGLAGNIRVCMAGNIEKAGRIAECFLGCKGTHPIIKKEQALARSVEMRTLEIQVRAQIDALRSSGQEAQANAIEAQLEGILAKMM